MFLKSLRLAAGLAVTISIAALSGTALAQEMSSDDNVLVTNVVQTYFDGYAAGDTTKLATVFHRDFHLSWVDPFTRPGRSPFKQVDRKGLFRFFGPNWSTQYKVESELISVETDGDAATAKALVSLVGIVEWTDYLSLLKIDGKWWIVAKISKGKRL